MSPRKGKELALVVKKMNSQACLLNRRIKGDNLMFLVPG